MRANLLRFMEKVSSKTDRVIKVADLKPITNLRSIFREIRDYFAGNVTGITRDEKIAQNIIRLLFCKIYDELNSQEITEFSVHPDDNYDSFQKRINSLFERVKKTYSEIFETDEKIEIKPDELLFIVTKLEQYSIINAERDVIGDAFEELIGTSFRGSEGQFFTPRNVVRMIVEVLSPQEGERIIDPACGSGGFLAYIVQYLTSRNINNYYLVGIEKDSFLAKIARAYLTILSKGKSNFDVFCENSLEVPDRWSNSTKEKVKLGSFDVVLTNPPFGAKIPVIGKDLLSQYRLGHRWKQYGKKWKQLPDLLQKQPPQILFIERCLQLLREGGRLGIVLPEGIFGNPSYRYIWEYIHETASVIGVVSLPQETFQPSTHTKTSVLFLKKTTSKPKYIFMAIGHKVGHNKNGKPIYKIDEVSQSKVLDDDLPVITKRFNAFNKGERIINDHLGFCISYEDLKDHIFIPEYYNPEIQKELDSLERTGKYFLISIGDLVDKGILQIQRGHEIGSQFYGTGNIPFVRTSDIVNWEIKVDPIKCVSEEVYNKYKDIQDIKEEDILFVNDGTFLIGRTAMVTRLDTRIIIQSHIRKIRVLDRNFIDPYYMFYLLNTKIVKKQIESKIFVQATISTLGDRLKEVILPISKDENEIRKIVEEVKSIIEQKVILRERIMKIMNSDI